MGIVGVMRRTAGLRIVRQSLGSLETFGDIRGEDWLSVSRKHASDEARRACVAAVQETCDTGRPVRVRVWSPCPGEFTVRDMDDGLLLTTWRSLTHDERIEAFMARWPSLDERR